MSRNDITGDSLVSKASTKEYTESHERIFGKRPPWYVTRDEREKQEQENEHRQFEVGQASAADKR
jgi:hypothetical protein